MLNMESLLPHSKRDNKVESKESKGATLNELAELKNCSSCLFFECRKHKDLYLWMAKSPNGPSVKFLVNAVHTMEELKLTGNHLKGSRPLLTFTANFEKGPHWKLLKALIMQCPQQPGSYECGYYVMKWMYDITTSYSKSNNDLKKCIAEGGHRISCDQTNDIREKWAQFVNANSVISNVV